MVDAPAPDDVLAIVRTQLDRMLATARTVASSLEPDTVLATIVESATQLLGGDSGDILLWDRGPDVLRVVAVSDFPPEMLGFEARFGTGLSSQAILAQRTLEVEDYRAYEHRLPELDHYDFGSVLCSPLLFRGEAIGALNIHARGRRHRFPQGSADLLAAFAGHAAIAIDHARRYENEVALGRDLARANRELTRVLRVQQRLAGHVLADGEPQGIAVILAEELGRSVIIEDDLHRRVAAAAPDGSDPGPLAAGDAGPPTIVPLRVNRAVAGFLVLAHPQALDPVDRALIDAAATGAALAFARTQAALEVEERLRGAAIGDLLAGTYESEAAISARMARLGHDLDRPHRVYVLRLADGIGGEDEPARSVLAVLLDRLRARGDRGAGVVHGPTLVLLVPDEPPTAAEVLAGELLAGLRDIPAAAQGTLGIGERCHRPGDYTGAVARCRDAVDLAVRLGRAGTVVDATRLGSDRLLLQAASRLELEAFARGVLDPVATSGTMGPELIRTLRIHLEEGRNQRRTADRCVLHVNTVADRLRRIERLLRLDLDDPSAVFDLTLALRVADALGLDLDGRAAVDSPIPTA